jgi:hypothetical protein
MTNLTDFLQNIKPTSAQQDPERAARRNTTTSSSSSTHFHDIFAPSHLPPSCQTSLFMDASNEDVVQIHNPNSTCHHLRAKPVIRISQHTPTLVAAIVVGAIPGLFVRLGVLDLMTTISTEVNGMAMYNVVASLVLVQLLGCFVMGLCVGLKDWFYQR